MIALKQSRWVLGLTLLALFCAGPAFAQPTSPSFSFTFDENGHGSFTINGGPATPLVSFLLSDNVVFGVETLFYPLPFPVTFPVTEGFVGLNEPGTPGFPSSLPSDVLHFSSPPLGFNGVYFYSDLAEPGQASDLADGLGILFARGRLFIPGSQLIPELGSEGTNGATYVPVVAGSGTPTRTMNDPGFILDASTSYHIISDAEPGSTVPEPSSLILLVTGVGLVSLARIARRRHRRK
jgi:hypothetical protein